MSQSLESDTKAPQSGSARRNAVIAAMLLMLIGTLIRVAGIADEPLWYDELYSATQASSPLTEVVAAVRAFDMHPPLYYLQLSAWAKLGSSDAWLRLNSTLWWLLTGCSLYFITDRLINNKTAILTTAFFIVNPTGFHFAQELRMYSMLMCFAVWSYYLTETWFAARQATGKPSSEAASLDCRLGRIRWRDHLPILLVTTACVYSHGASFMILLGIWAHAAWMLATSKTNRRSFMGFMAIQLLAVMIGLAEHVRAAAMHLNFEQGLSYASAPSFAQWIQQTSWLFSGRSEPFGVWTISLTVLLTGIPLALACCSAGPVRRAILFYAAVPILACLAVSHLSRPIWVFRAISFTVPFCCLGLAFGLQRINWSQSASCSLRAWTLSLGTTTLRTSLIVAILVGSCIGIRSQASFYPRPSYFADMAQQLRQSTDAGDVIFVPQRYSYWALCWYLVEPASVRPFTDSGVKRTDRGVTVVKTDAKQDLPLANWTAEQSFATSPPRDQIVESDKLTRFVSQSTSGRLFLLTTGAAQAEHLVAEVRRRHNLTPTHVAQHGTIALWELP